MAQRLPDQVAIVTGAGSAGPGRGNGKATGAVELTRLIAAIAMAYITGQTVVDTWGE